jgi:hypothetical protein
LRNPKALVDQLLTNVRYDAQNADRVLRPLDITCPPLSSYAEKIVAAVEERLMGRPAVMPEKAAAPPSQPPPPPTAKRDEESTHETDAMD